MKNLLIIPLIASLGGCGPLGAAAGMGALSGILGGAATGEIFAAPPISLKQEMLDVEAATALVHQHEMTILAIEQQPVLTTVQQPVVVTGTPMNPPITVTPVGPPTGLGQPLPPRPPGSPAPVVGNP